jgi:hypothetical protein
MSPLPHGLLRRAAGTRVLAVLLAVALVAVTSSTLGAVAPDVATGRHPAPAGPPASVAQTTTRFYVPNAQSEASLALLGTDIVPTGMDGMGETEFELTNLGRQPVAWDAQFISGVASNVVASGVLPPLGGTRFAMATQKEIDFAPYSGTFSGTGPFAGIVRTTWFGGASAAYESVTPSRDLVLPLVAREVYSHSSIIYIKNLSAPGVENPIDFDLVDTDGSIVQSWTVTMKGDESLPDDLFSERGFYESFLPHNAAGGFIGAFNVTSRDPVAIMVYGDEPWGIGTYALSARPRTAANRQQYLPLVRANYSGNSLIAVSNADNRAVDVTVTYRGHPGSPSGAGETYTQQFRLGPRFYGAIDLSPRGRGSLVAPELPRGTGASDGFLGNATISASGPVMAAVWEEDYDGSRVQGSAAYNAFGPNDLGKVFIIPHAFGTPDEFPTFLIAMNPGTTDATVTTSLLTDDGRRYAELRTSPVAAGGGMSFIPISTAYYEHVRVLAESTVPIALLVLDGLPTRDRTAYQAVRLPDDTGTFPTPVAPLTPTAGPTSTSTPSVRPPTRTPGPTATGSIHLVNHIFMPRALRKK